jgi:hypothetical protein
MGGGEKIMKVEYGRSSKRNSNFAHYSKEYTDTVFNQFKDSIERQVGDSICPEHGMHPTVKVKGRNIDKIKFEVSGCCKQLIDIVNSKLK